MDGRYWDYLSAAWARYVFHQQTGYGNGIIFPFELYLAVGYV